MAMTVHVVDDEPLVLDSTALLLRSHGFIVRLYESAEAFLAGGEPPGPCCVLVDNRMPGIGGRKLLDRVVASRWPVPIILSSGHMDPADGARAIRHGATAAIEKPYTEQALLDAIAAATTALISGRSSRAIGAVR